MVWENMMIGATPAGFSGGIAAPFKDAALRASRTSIGRCCIAIVNYFSATVRRTANKLVSRLDAISLRGYSNFERWARLRIDGVKKSLRWRFAK
jgi:hypothetical protein